MDKQEDLIDILNRKIEIKDKYLQNIIDFGYDYDGFNGADNLKLLIDMLVDYAHKAIVCDIISPNTVDEGGNEYNILGELVVRGDEKDD